MAQIKNVKEGQIWLVKVSNRIVRCKVVALREKGGLSRRRIKLLNLSTDREISRSARSLRKLVA